MFRMGDTLSFAKWLLDEMQQHNWSQSVLAKKAGLGRSVINRAITQFKYAPKPETCVSIATALGKSPVTVFRIAGILPPDTENVPELEDFKNELAKVAPDIRQELLETVRVRVRYEGKRIAREG
jgi:transcriptional regulator with XRE-family HTH domain